MSQKKDWRAELEQVAEKLRDPMRMRMAVAGVALAVMYFGISEPLYGRMKQEKRELTQLENRVKTAEEVLLLRDHLNAVESRILSEDGEDIVVAHLIEIVREHPVDLMRIDAGISRTTRPDENDRGQFGPQRIVSRADQSVTPIRVGPLSASCRNDRGQSG